MAFDPTTAAQKWADRLSQAANDGTIQRGVQAVQVAPGQLAARQKQAWVQNTPAAADKWAANTAAVSNQEWQQATIEKGIQRVATGATQSQPKMAAFLTALKPAIDNAKGALPPRGTYAQNKQRMVMFADAMHNFTYKK